MKAVIAGGRGFIGSVIADHLQSAGYSVSILTRRNSAGAVDTRKGVSIVPWDAQTVSSWLDVMDGADVVVNLSGEPLDARRWSQAQKERILNSRVSATRALVEAMGQTSMRPRVFVSASAVGFYGPVEEGELTEASPGGEGFLALTCRMWESEALAAEPLGVRVALSRFGVVLGRKGALGRMLTPFRLFAGGPLGTGRQWFPWIHHGDVAGAMLHIIRHTELVGPVNVTAPGAVRMEEFCAALGEAMHRPSWARVPSFVLKALLGEMSSMVLTGQRVVPAKLLHSGYRFQFPGIAEALEDILHRS